MKFKIVFICYFLFTMGAQPSIGQNRKPTFAQKAIKLGDKVPMLPFKNILSPSGASMNSINGSTTLIDFGDKMVILDFWGIYCTNCIAGFPKMSELQRKYGDKIQIILVNPYDTKEAVQEWINRYKNRGRQIVPENLPIITDAKSFEALFPGRGEMGYHVWIAPDKRVVLRGIAQNTHEKKILQYLSGEKINFIQDNALKYNGGKEPFFIKASKNKLQKNQYLVNISGFIDTLANPYGAGSDGIIDSVNQTSRISLINMQIADLYRKAFLYNRKSDDAILYGSNTIIDPAAPVQNLLSELQTDDEYRAGRFSYEQILPNWIPEDDRRKVMQSNINAYLQSKLGIYAELENRKVPCYILAKTAKWNSNELKRLKTETGKLIEFVTREKFEWGNDLTGNIFSEYLKNISSNSNLSDVSLVIDKTGLIEKIDIVLPEINSVRSIDDLKTWLNRYGLDIEKGETDARFLVIKQSKK